MMKKNCILILFSVLSISLFAQKWEFVEPILPLQAIDDKMNKVYAQGENNVYLVGKNGLIAKSTDKALNWTKSYFPSRTELNDIIFCNADVGFIVGNNGTILKTENAGANWRQIAIETTEHIYAIAASGLDNIWIAGAGGLTIYSTDAGETWTTKIIASDNQDLFIIKFRENIGYLSGEGEKVFKTENRGATWEEQIIELPADYRIYSLNITENKVYALANTEYSTSGLIIETDNYSTWTIVNGSPTWGFKGDSYFSNDFTGFLMIYDYTTGSGDWMMWILKTLDGGNTWHEEDIIFYGSRSLDISYPGNFSFSENNEFGYFLCGDILLRTPYTGEFYIDPDGLYEIKSEKVNLAVKQHGNVLQINSFSKPISGVEIISAAGVKQRQEIKKPANEIEFDINSLSKGIYLIRAEFADKTKNKLKWIKQ
jgi:photosystem II stability/assembly factor-like uncharacterized protein